MSQVQKEYKDRWNKPLVNPPVDIFGRPFEGYKSCSTCPKRHACPYAQNQNKTFPIVKK